MVKSINLFDKNIKFSCKFYCNNNFIKESRDSHNHDFIIPETPAHCKIEIQPWKLKPLVRFDNQLVNYGLAEITPWDHMLEFKLDENFLKKYFKNIISNKKKYLERTGQNVPDNMENYVGINHEHKEIINQILEKIK